MLYSCRLHVEACKVPANYSRRFGGSCELSTGRRSNNGIEGEDNKKNVLGLVVPRARHARRDVLLTQTTLTNENRDQSGRTNGNEGRSERTNENRVQSGRIGGVA